MRLSSASRLANFGRHKFEDRFFFLFIFPITTRAARYMPDLPGGGGGKGEGRTDLPDRRPREANRGILRSRGCRPDGAPASAPFLRRPRRELSCAASCQARGSPRACRVPRAAGPRQRRPLLSQLPAPRRRSTMRARCSGPPCCLFWSFPLNEREKCADVKRRRFSPSLPLSLSPSPPLLSLSHCHSS